MPDAVNIAHGLEECQQWLQTILQQAHQHIDILSYDLDSALYNHIYISDMLSDFVLESRYKRIRILIQEPRLAIQGGHHLIELGKQLSSYIQLRCPAEQHHSKGAAQFIIVDHTDIFYQQFSDNYKVEIYFDKPLLAAPFIKQFENQWSTAESHPDLRYFA